MFPYCLGFLTSVACTALWHPSPGNASEGFFSGQAVLSLLCPLGSCMPGTMALITAWTISCSGTFLFFPFSIWWAKLEKLSLSFCPGSPIWPDILNSLCHRSDWVRSFWLTVCTSYFDSLSFDCNDNCKANWSASICFCSFSCSDIWVTCNSSCCGSNVFWFDNWISVIFFL